MEYFRLNLYRQGTEKIQKGAFGLRPEVVAAAPAVFMGLLLLLFVFRVYLPKRSTLVEKRAQIETMQKQIEALDKAGQIIKPVEKQFLELRKERVSMTPQIQNIAETIPTRVWMTGLEWRPAPVTGRQPPAQDPFAFRKNELTIKGRAFSRPGQAPLGLVNEFISALSDPGRLGGLYNVDLGRTFETRVQKPQTKDRTTSLAVTAAQVPEYRSVLDFTIRCRIKE